MMFRRNGATLHNICVNISKLFNATKLVNNFFFSAFSYISFKDLYTKLQHERRLTKAISLKNMNEILIGNRYQSV